jgi:hypothetical protein
MEENEQHSHLARKETKTSSQAEEISSSSSPHSIHSQNKEPGDKRKPAVMEHEHHHHHQSAQPKTSMTSTAAATASMTHAMTTYNVNIQFDPAIPQAGKPTHLNLMVSEQKVGEPIKQFDMIHDKLMHLIIVNSEDLSHFAHLHPKLDEKTGVFHIGHTFQRAGKYKLWSDTKPKGGIQILTAFAFNVEGQPVHTPANITVDKKFGKEVSADGQAYQITLDFHQEHLHVGRDIKMTFEISDANGNPISNLEPLMAAGGHCVIIDADAREFLHVHPAEEIDDIANWRGGPSVSFLVNFPKPGLYRAWGQFQHEGRLLIADFTFEVLAR